MCSAEEVQIIARHLEELLNGAILNSKMFSGKDAVKPDNLADILGIACSLAEIHRRDLPLAEARSMDIIEFAFEIVEGSELAFGKSIDPQVSCAKSLLSFVKATLLLEDADTERSKLELRKAKAEIQTTFASNPIAMARLDEFLKGKDPDQVRFWQAFINAYPSHFDMIEDAWGAMSQHALGDTNAGLTHSLKLDARDTAFFNVWQVFPHLLKTHEAPSFKLDSLETELNRGHWARVMGIHGGLALRSIQTLDFDQARKHVEAQESLALEHGQESSFVDKAADAKKFIHILQSMTTSLTSEEDLIPEAFESFHLDAVDLMDKRGIDTTETTKIHNYVSKSFRDNDPTLNHNSAPGILKSNGDRQAWMQTLFERHLIKCSRSSEYRQNWLSGLSTVFSTLEKLEYGEDENDAERIFECLNKFDELCRDEWCSEHINEAAIQERRSWNAFRLCVDTLSQIKALVEANKYDEAYMLLRKAEHITSLGNLSKPEMQEGILQLFNLVEQMHLTPLLTKPRRISPHTTIERLCISLATYYSFTRMVPSPGQ